MMEALPWLNTALIAAGFLFTFFMGTRNRTSTSERELATMKLQVDTMWAAFLASGIVKGITRGNLEMNSPVRLSGNSATLMEELRPNLEDFRNGECANCNESELALKIANKFRERIIEISALNGWTFELGLVIATSVAKGGQPLSQILDEFHATMAFGAVALATEATAKLKKAADDTAAAAEATADAAAATTDAAVATVKALKEK